MSIDGKVMVKNLTENHNLRDAKGEKLYKTAKVKAKSGILQCIRKAPGCQRRQFLSLCKSCILNELR